MNKIEMQAVNLLTIIQMTAPKWGHDLTIHELRQVFLTAVGVIEARRHLDYSKEVKNANIR